MEGSIMPIHDERGRETRPLPIVHAEHSDEIDDFSLLPASHPHDEHNTPTPGDADDGQQIDQAQGDPADSDDDDKTLEFSFEALKSLVPLAHMGRAAQDGHSEPKEQNDGHVPV